MRTGITVSFTVMGLMGWASAALAAVERADQSSFIVWIFLAFCALIVIAQLLPALRARVFERLSKAKIEHPLATEKKMNR
jgi:hypothetical protein